MFLTNWRSIRLVSLDLLGWVEKRWCFDGEVKQKLCCLSAVCMHTEQRWDKLLLGSTTEIVVEFQIAASDV